MSKIAKILLIAVAVLAVVELALLGFLMLGQDSPYDLAENSMPVGGTLTLYAQSDGTFTLEWPSGQNTDIYTVTITQVGTGKVLFSENYEGTLECTIPALSTDQDVTIQVSSSARYQESDDSAVQLRPGNTALEVTTSLEAPSPVNLSWSANAEYDLLTIHMDLAAAETCRVYMSGSSLSGQAARTFSSGDFSIAFGDEGDYPLPTGDETYSFSFEICRAESDLIFYGLTTESITITREDFLESTLRLTYEDLGNNVYRMEWNETHGESYEIQVKDTATGNWKTVYTVGYEGDRTYTTEHLDRFVRYQFRVIAVGGQLQEGSLYAAEPCEISFTTGACALYATIWPLHTLDVYADTEGSEVIATAEKGTAFCVIGTSGDLFRIRTPNGEGYIDARYCMINLPDYLGDLCSYDITNSYDSLYMVHDYEISNVTGTVITGYEYVQTADGDFLVPLLYPAAQKLVVAAQDAISKGYRLKIYDSYRPRSASSDIYSKTNSILYNAIPDTTYTGRIMTDLPVLAEGVTLTYYNLMTNDGRYGLGNFLAANGSNHNLGVAMDLTLEKMYSSQEMLMQTSMHDLSWYSEVSQNNTNANLLKQIMTNAGFGGLTSEWWHFQDNDSKAELGLVHLWTGVDSECWVRDDSGWRYRQADGTYLKNCTKTIDGVSYTFNSSGYAY